MIKRVFDQILSSDALSAEEARQMSFENESAVENMGVRSDDIHLTNPLSFRSAYQKARAGDPSWIEDFDLVGCNLIDALRRALGEECRAGKIRAIEAEKMEAEKMEAVMRADRERVKANNEKIKKELRGM